MEQLINLLLNFEVKNSIFCRACDVKINAPSCFNLLVSLFLTKSEPETEQPFFSRPIANADIPIPPIPIK